MPPFYRMTQFFIPRKMQGKRGQQRIDQRPEFYTSWNMKFLRCEWEITTVFVFYVENAGYGKVLTWFFSRIFLLPLPCTNFEFLESHKEAFDYKVSSFFPKHKQTANFSISMLSISLRPS